LDLLTKNLEKGDCVPFLGAGACADYIPLGSRLAGAWADSAGYPMRDKDNLSRVMQFVATSGFAGDAISLKKEFVKREFGKVTTPDFGDPAQIHGLLAGLDLPLYVTTNYDDFMYLALQHARKTPRQDHSPWYVTGAADPFDSPLDDASYTPSPAEPLVFHLHGHYSVPQSLVLTEDDYIEYLVQLARESRRRAGVASGLLPAYVYGQLRSRPLLFVGYSLRDWTFMVLFRTLLYGIADSQRRYHVSVQIDPRERAPRKARVYLERYFLSQRIQIFWSTASEFAQQLNDRIGGTTK
jgi:hypothetical protein